jgi:hypothetical protein
VQCVNGDALKIILGCLSNLRQTMDLGSLWTSQWIKCLVTHVRMVTSCDQPTRGSLKGRSGLLQLESSVPHTHQVSPHNVFVLLSILDGLLPFFQPSFTSWTCQAQTLLRDLIRSSLLYNGLMSSHLGSTHVKLPHHLDVLSSSGLDTSLHLNSWFH